MLASVAGTVFEDINGNGTHEPDEPGLRNVVVFIDSNQNGLLDQTGFGLEPDEFNAGVLANALRTTVTPSTITGNAPTAPVYAVMDGDRASTGDLVFGQEDSSIWTNEDGLRFDFATLVGSVSLDVIGASETANANVVLDAFSPDGELLGSSTTGNLASGEFEQLVIERGESDIGYVIARVSNELAAAAFDNLRVNDVGSERATLTSEGGHYRFLNELAGQEVTIRQVVPEGYIQTDPISDLAHTAFLTDTTTELDFANRTSKVEGSVFNDDGLIGIYEPLVDQLIESATVYLDVNGNGVVDQQSVAVDPDSYQPNQLLEPISPAISISVTNTLNQISSNQISASADEISGGLVFAHGGDVGWSNENRLRFDFAVPASSVELDFIAGAQIGQEKGFLIAFSRSGEPIASTTTRLLERGQRATMAILRSTADISHIVAYTVESETGEGRLDNLRATVVNEPVAITDAGGSFEFRPILPGDYRVGAIPMSGQRVTFPETAVYEVDVSLGEVVSGLNFGFQSINQSPIARGDTISTIEEIPIGIGVLLNDTDADGIINLGSIVITQPPLHGSAEITADGFINYAPNEDFFGRDTLIYTVRDDQGAESNSAIVTIDVGAINDPPRAANDVVAVLRDSLTVIDLLRNDTDVDGQIDRRTIAIASPPTHGRVEVNEVTGNVTYTPSGTANDTFTYTVRDDKSARSNVGTVTVTAVANGIPPVAGDDMLTTLEGTPKEIQVLENDTDDDGFINRDSIVIVVPPTRGTVLAGPGVLIYRPNLGFVGEDSFSYSVRDDSGLSSNHARVVIEISERDFPYQNPIDAMDVNADGFIVPRDALLIINEINDRAISDPATGKISMQLEPMERPTLYLDVTGDGFVVSNDVLRVINALNTAPSDIQSQIAASAILAAKLTLADDDEEPK